MLSLLLAVRLLVSTVFGTVSSLHPTSFLMIFIFVSLIFLSRLSLDCSARRDAIRSTRATRIAYTYAHEYCARELNGRCDVQMANGNRRDGPGSCFVKVRYYRTTLQTHHARK